MGEKWLCVEAPIGVHLKQISVNTIGVWTVCRRGNLYIRKDVTYSNLEGTSWHCVNITPTVIGKTKIFMYTF